MKNTFIILISLFALMVVNTEQLSAQSKLDPKWSDKYHEPTMAASDIIKVIDKYKFKPAIRKIDDRTLKTVLLQFEADAIKQLNISSWHLCSTKHDDYFTIWNMYYTKISKSDWDQNCKELISLMIIDGTAKDR